MDDKRTDIVNWTKFAAARAQLGANFIRILGYFREDGDKAVARIEAAMQGRDAAALVLPAHTLKSEARQFGADRLGDVAEEIEMSARRAVEARLFPDQILPQVAELRALYEETATAFDAESNPLAVRRQPAQQLFGRR
ncbi:MAG: Hpt domain-containing protein [Allosphingosinicella sp.]|uniref:Hpt domain-containing protein n=1 Tax=Allosphingosinicella sp. TaxID=2823234 RepID=UPI00392D175E